MRGSILALAAACSGACMNGPSAEDAVGETCDVFAQDCPRDEKCVAYVDDLDVDPVVNLCVPTCDPLAQDCGGNDGCYWSGSDFLCVAAAGDTPLGEPCNAVNDCAKGTACERDVPDCPTSLCCTNLCELELGDEQCQALIGTTCQPLDARAEVGACTLGFSGAVVARAPG